MAGYLKPVYSKFDPEVGHWVHAYLQPEFDKIAQGYACGQCGEDFGGIYLTRCPVCRFETLTVADRVGDPPPEWGGRR